MNKVAITIGAIAGFSATGPMSVFMQWAHDRLPGKQKYPLPPRLITEKLTAPIQPERSLVDVLTLLNHFGYGASMGAIYGSMLSPQKPGSLKTGNAFGLAVWTVSYLGFLPVFSIMAPATEHPPKRTALMIAAHLVWGSYLGWLTKKLLLEKRQQAELPEAAAL